jgi:hypothetical protein
MEYTLGKFKSTDIFTMATLLSKIGLGKITDAFGRDNVMKILSDFKGKKKEDVTAFTGMQVALQVGEIILGNLENCESEIFKLLSSVSGLSDDDLRNMDADVFAGLIVDVVHLPQFKDFFKAASRLLNTAK